MEQMIYNEWGEPIGTEYVRDAWEEQEAMWEEQMRMADDPLYAMQVENEAWLAKAHAAFESQGIQVPYDVEKRLAQEMRKKARQLEEERQLAMAQPYVDLLNRMIEGCGACARHQPETIDEVAYTYIEFKDAKKVTKDAIKMVNEEASKTGINYDFEMFVY